MALNKWDKQHLVNLGLTQRQIDSIFDMAAKEAAAIGASLDDFNPNKPFSFSDYPQTKARIDKLIKSLQKNVETVIVNGVQSEWTLSNNKNNALCDLVFGDNKYKLTKEQERKYYSNNDKAREAFISRKTKGLNLSDRVWKYTDQFKTEIEFGIDLDLRDGTSAAEMARNLKQYLREPAKLFRRIRDERGELQLSRAAKAYNSGAGVYRSSYKNALRLARTETNMAYRTADHERWQQLDFVVGIEIRLSNNHTLNGKPFFDICDTLQGKYPKDFKFTGWHPQCRCHAVPILKTVEELNNETTESVNEVKDVPENFNKWVEDNKDRIEEANNRGTLPYFLKDNNFDEYLKSNTVDYVNDEYFEKMKNYITKSDKYKLASSGGLQGERFSKLKEFTDKENVDYVLEQAKKGKDYSNWIISSEESFEEWKRIVNDDRFILDRDMKYAFGVDKGGLLNFQKNIKDGVLTTYGSRYMAINENRTLNYAKAGTEDVGAIFSVKVSSGNRVVHAKVFDLNEAVLLPGSKFKITSESIVEKNFNGKIIKIPKYELELTNDGTDFISELKKFKEEVNKRLKNI